LKTELSLSQHPVLAPESSAINVVPMERGGDGLVNENPITGWSAVKQLRPVLKAVSA